MDAQPAGLPPIPAVTPVPVLPGAFPPGQARPAALPVGRPSLDPAQNEARVERSRKTARLEGLTPQRAKDDKLHVFASSNGRTRGKPVLTLLASDIEAELGANPDGNQLDDLISRELPDKYPDGTYKCQWYDRNNRAVTDPPPWDIDIGDAEQFEDEEEDEELDLPADPRTMPVQVAFPQPPIAPAPPAMDLAAVGTALRTERQEESRRGSDMMTLVVSMQNMAQQNMAQMQQAQQQQQALQQQWQREAEERERARRAEFRTTLMTMIPLVLPLIQAWMAPKSGMSAEMTALLELVKGMATNKGSDAAMMENMIRLQGQMTENQMKLQATGANAAVQMQAEASAMVFKNLMGTMKELMENKPEKTAEDEGTLASVAKMVVPFLANMAQQNQQNQQPAPEMPTAQPQPVQRQPRAVVAKPLPPAAEEEQQPVEGSAPRRGRRVSRPAGEQPAPAAPQPQPSDFPDVKRIEGCLNAVRRMSLGKPTPPERWSVVEWIAKWLPADMLAAVNAGDKDKVNELGAAAALSNTTILQWITDDENQEFLKDVLEDVRLLVAGKVTKELAEASIIKHGVFVQRRRNAAVQADRQAQEAIDRHNNPSEANEGPKAVAEATVVPPAGAPAPSVPQAPVEGTIVPPVAAKPAEAPRPGKPPPPVPPSAN